MLFLLSDSKKGDVVFCSATVTFLRYDGKVLFKVCSRLQIYKKETRIKTIQHNNYVRFSTLLKVGDTSIYKVGTVGYWYRYLNIIIYNGNGPLAVRTYRTFL
jgi:hypothetical protein